MDPKSFDTYLARVKREPLTANTMTDEAVLRNAIATVRETGLGRSRSEYALGVAGFAMGVRHAGALVGILNVSVPEPRLSTTHTGFVESCLQDAVIDLERRLNG